MPRIKLLPDALINKIAAGEVVERPSSVVKELCENSVDAGASQVSVVLAHGGLELVSVSDDGAGMSRADALLAMHRHATSKLDSFEGLFQIMSKGFRGEALPAIASVSHFTLTTSEAGAAVGTRLSVDGGSEPLVEDAAPAGGTRIDVADLFFNTPARRKFMRRDATELIHCQEAIYRLALAHPEVAFSIEHDGRPLFRSPAAAEDPTERIAAALGAEVHPHLLKIEERRLGIEVTGYVASPEYTLPTARGLYTLVNRRYIRDRHLIFAIQRAFQDALPPGRQPVAVLYIDLDPATVDVNVHPQKLEVRFSDARGVQEAVSAGVMRALKSAPWHGAQQAEAPSSEGAWYQHAVQRFLDRAQQGPSSFEPPSSPSLGESLGFGQARPTINEAPPEGFFAGLKFFGDLGQRLWVCEAPGGSLMVLDPKAVRERLTLHRLLDAKQPPVAQAGLFSATVELDDEALAGRLEQAAPQLLTLGVDVERFGPKTMAIRGLPFGITPPRPELLLTELLAELPAEGADDEQAWLRAKQVLAAHAGAEAWRTVTQAEVRSLLTELDRADFSVPCLNGRVVVHQVALHQLVPQA